MARIKSIVKSLLPNLLPRPIHGNGKQGLSTKDTFARIYAEGAWGVSSNPTQRFFSGSGSHDLDVVNPYIEAVQSTISSFPVKPSVVDLGCGDFYVGSRIRTLCASYIACDIVDSLIDYNRHTYRELDVDFRVLNLCEDELPAADIVFIRQVFQHLSNKEIRAAIPQIVSKYKYLVLTEHLPPKAVPFVHNLDKPTGPGIRIGLNSGVVLTSPPFNLKITEGACICEVEAYGGTIRTDLYRLSQP